MFVDEIQMDPSVLNSIAVADIAFVKVMKTPVVVARNAAGGAIAIYTKRGEPAEGDEAAR